MKYKIRLPEDIREARDRAQPCPAAKKYFMASSNRPSYVIGEKDTSGLSAIERLRQSLLLWLRLGKTMKDKKLDSRKHYIDNNCRLDMDIRREDSISDLTISIR
jgi:hypothetical protein